MWRKHVLDYDDVMNQQRTIVYGMRNSALLCEEPREMLDEALAEATRYKCDLYLNEDSTGTVRHTDLLQWINSTFPMGLSEKDAELDNKTPEEVVENITAKVRELYAKKVEGERPDRVDAMERNIMLQSIDKLWQQHITDMDALREGVRLRAQGQRDPLVEYKREAYDIFETLMHNIDLEMCNNLFRSTTSLNAFEDFLASLPASNAEEEDSDVTDLLGNGDLLSALREHLGMIRARQQEMGAAEEAEPALPEAPALTEPAPQGTPTPLVGEDMPLNESLSGAMVPGMPLKEKKMVLPKKKVTVKIRRAEGVAETPVVTTPVADAAEGEAAVPSLTLGTIGSGSMLGTEFPTTVEGAEAAEETK